MILVLLCAALSLQAHTRSAFSPNYSLGSYPGKALPILHPSIDVVIASQLSTSSSSFAWMNGV